MKKVFVMILLLVFSMPALSVEIKLVCKLNGESDFSYSFDEEKRTVNGYSIDDRCRSACIRYFISDTEFGDFYLDEEGRLLRRDSISRSDGSYHQEDSDYKVIKTGTCVLFKKAF